MTRRIMMLKKLPVAKITQWVLLVTLPFLAVDALELSFLTGTAPRLPYLQLKIVIPQMRFFAEQIFPYLSIISLILFSLSALVLLLQRKLKYVQHESANQNSKWWWGLALILLFFMVIKIPYMQLPFSGAYATKYATHVEPALAMTKNRDYFLYQKRYMASRSGNAEGIFTEFSGLPLLEWLLAGSYQVLPFSVAVNTRVVMQLIAVAGVTGAFLLLRRVTSSALALLGSFLIGWNAIFQLSTFLTVLDSLLLAATFCSVYFFVKYLQTKSVRSLFWAGIGWGVAVSLKYSVVLWLSPIILTLAFSYAHQRFEWLKSVGFYHLVGLLPVLLFLTGIRSLPSQKEPALMISLLWFITICVTYYFRQKIMAVLENVRKLFFKYAWLFPTSLALSSLIFIVLLKSFKLDVFIQNFITEADLLFYWPMYQKIGERLYQTLGGTYVLFAVTGLAITAINMKKSSFKYLITAFTVGSLVYLLLAAKAIYFHTYYHLIFMSTLMLGLVVFMVTTVNLYKGMVRVLLVALLALIILKQAARIHAQLSFYNAQSQLVAEYLTSLETKSQAFLLDVDPYTFYPVVISTQKTPGNELIRLIDFPAKVDAEGMFATLRGQGITHVVSAKSTRAEIETYFTELYADFNQVEQRADQIKQLEARVNPTLMQNSVQLDIYQHLQLIDMVGGYYIYALVD